MPLFPSGLTVCVCACVFLLQCVSVCSSFLWLLSHALHVWSGLSCVWTTRSRCTPPHSQAETCGAHCCCSSSSSFTQQWCWPCQWLVFIGLLHECLTPDFFFLNKILLLFCTVFLLQISKSDLLLCKPSTSCNNVNPPLDVLWQKVSHSGQWCCQHLHSSCCSLWF